MNFLSGSVRSNGFLSVLIAATAILAGCDLSTGEVSSGINQFEQVRNPIGHVTGIVLDSNSRPINGATVTIGSRSTKTKNGSYEFRNVEVVNVTTTTDNDTDHDSIRIIVTPPAVTTSQPTAYLGAIVYVYPEAQFNETNEGLNDENQALETAGSQAVFIDGFHVQAYDAVLPELTASAEVLSLRDASTGQVLPAGTSVTLDFVDVRTTSDSDEASGTVQYPTATWSATTSASGNVTFTGIPANSILNMHIRGYICDDGSEPDDEDNDNKGEPDTCELTTENETNMVTFENFYGTLLADNGDDVFPYIKSVTGVYTSAEPAGPYPATRCDIDGDDVGPHKIGKLLRDITGAGTGAVRLVLNEALQTALVDADSAVVFDYTVGEYADISNVAASGSSVTVTTSAALPEGSEFSIFLFRPDFLDLAGNVLIENTDSDFPYDCTGEITPEVGSGTSFLALDLERFKVPSTDTGAAAPLQEAIDPEESGAANDLPANQLRSVAYNDVRDNSNLALEQMNNSNTDASTGGVDVALVRRAEAFGELMSGGFIQNYDMARIEWAPVSGATGYRVVVAGANGGGSEDLSNAALATAEDSAGCSINSETCYYGTAVRTAGTAGVTGRTGTLYYILIDGSTEGDTVTIVGLDELGNPGDATGTATIVDNVKPTVIVQRSYQNTHDFALDGDEDSDDQIQIDGETFDIQQDAGGENISGCYVDPDTNIPIDPEHSGVALAAGSDDFGDGGELSQGGSTEAFGNLCIGIAPELFIDSDQDSSTAHTELEAGNDADYDPSVTTLDGDRAYDAGAFTAWAAARPEIRMGAAFSEGLAETVGTVAYSGAAGLSAYLVQNDVVDSHLGEGNGTINDLVTFLVDDAYAMANGDHFETLDFTGSVTDKAGNVSTADTNSVLTVRDMWPPYATSVELNANGSLTAIFDTELLIEDENDNDELVFCDDSDCRTITLDDDTTCGGDSLNYALTVGGTQIDVGAGCMPDDINAAFDSTGLNYTDAGGADADHSVMDFSTVGDTRGNSWDVIDGADEPLFIARSELVDFAVAVDDGANTIVNGDGNDVFTFIITATHPIGNLFSAGGGGGGEALMFSNLTGCTGTAGNPADPFVCDENFVINYLDFTDGATGTLGICVPDVGSTAALSADLTTLTFDVVCAATTGIEVDDEVGLGADNPDSESRLEYGSVDDNDATIVVQ